MVHIRLGQTWKEDPTARESLLRAKGPSDRAVAAREVIDVIHLEVDGVDIGAGRTEGSLLQATEELVEATARLVAGAAQSSVAFQEGSVELLLRRRGNNALLSVVTLQRPARVLARDVEVELAALARAVQEVSRCLCQDLAEIQPLIAREPITRRLQRKATRLRRSSARPSQAPPLPSRPRTRVLRRRRGAPLCSFELHDEEGLISSYRGTAPDLGSLLPSGRVALRSSNGHELFSLVGTPFLILRDLSASAAKLVAAVRANEPSWTTVLALSERKKNLFLSLDLLHGSLKVDGRPAGSCPPLLLARAFLEGAIDLCGAIQARNPRQASNGYLTELRAGASELLAHVREELAGDLVAVPTPGVRPERSRVPSHVPLGPGQLRHLSFRRLFVTEVGPPCALFRHGRQILVSGEACTLLLTREGLVGWRAAGAQFCGAAAGAIWLWSHGELSCLDPGTGQVRWRRPSPLPDQGRPVCVWPLGRNNLVLAGASSLCSIDLASGRPAWQFVPPTATALAGSPFGTLLVAGTDTGQLYGLDSDGRVAWRLRFSGSLVAPPGAKEAICLATTRTDRGGTLLALDPATGRCQWRTPLDFSPTGNPVPFSGLLGVPGTVAGDTVIAAVDLHGQSVWTTAPSIGKGQLALAGLKSGGLVIKSSEGLCARLNRDGTSLWLRDRKAAHPPPGNVPPLLARRVVISSSEHVEALELTSGTLLGVAPMVAPVKLLTDDELTLHGVDAEGLLTIARLTTRLSVV